MKLANIVEPVAKELKETEKVLRRLVVSDVPVVGEILDHVTAYQGKRLRPILVLLCAGLTGRIPRASIETAAVVELLHTATLIHDDVVDRSHLRRGGPTVSSVWDNKAAVLTGDLFYSRVLSWMARHGDLDVVEIMSTAIKRICEGELMQSQNGFSHNVITEQKYFDIISLKTASLLAASCELGVLTSSKAGNSERSSVRRFGEHLGTAFQIKDDLMDYNGREETMGKPATKDLTGNIFTLPLIHGLQHSNNGNKHSILKMIKRGITKSDAGEIRLFVEESGGIAYADEKAKEHAHKALSYLDGFADSKYKTSLQGLAGFVTQRSF